MAFNDFVMNKLLICVEVDNAPSNRIAQRCGSTLTRTEPLDSLLHGTLIDLNHYTLPKK